MMMTVARPRKPSIHKEELTVTNVTSKFLASALKNFSSTDLPASGLLSMLQKFLRRVSTFLCQNVNPTTTEAKKNLRDLLRESLRMKVR